MKSLIAFTKKEITAQLRSAKFVILIVLFVIFAILNPVTAKVTPLLLELLSESMAESGMNITIAEVSVLDSWMQFFSNVPMLLLAFVMMEGNIFTREYGTGTLILSLTKGLDRYKVVASKSFILVVFWTLIYWLHFAVNYFTNMFFWDDLTTKNLGFAAVSFWLFGLFTISLVVLFSTMINSYIGVLGCTGGVVFGLTFLSIIPKVSDYFPTILQDGISLVYGMVEVKTYIPAVIISIAVTILCFVASVPLFNKKQL